jgi:hypothetical protein
MSSGSELAQDQDHRPNFMVTSMDLGEVLPIRVVGVKDLRGEIGFVGGDDKI